MDDFTLGKALHLIHWCREKNGLS